MEVVMGWLKNKQENLTFLILLMSADFVFVVIGIAHSYTGLGTARFSLGQDFGHAEVYQYVKLFWAGGLLSVLYVRSRHVIYLSWALLFLYLLMDDSLKIHEGFGGVIARQLEIPSMFGLRAQDFGELAASLVTGSVLLGLIALSYFFSDRSGKRFSFRLVLFLGLLAFFGVGIDLIHSASGPLMRKPLGIVEDGGEMFIVSIMCWFIFTTTQQHQYERMGQSGNHAGEEGRSRVEVPIS
jgi:hypothetical protein